MPPKTHKIGPGETLTEIAKREYGDSTLHDQIARYNRLADPNKVQLGTLISLPSKVDLTNPSKLAPSSHSLSAYTLIIGINPSTTTKSGAVNTANNPGHTIVAFRDSTGKLLRVFSYGPIGIGLGAAISCSAPGRTGYHLVATDEYKLYEWPITSAQYNQAMLKISQIEASPGTFSASHQCTTTSLEVATAADITTPKGIGKIYVPLCEDLKASAPVFLDRELEKRFKAEKKVIKRVKGSYFHGLVDIQSK